jgi:hypothetical protein
VKDRRKVLEAFTKQMKEGIPFSEDFISDLDSDIHNNALLARNLEEEALANEVLKNTGNKIPSDNAPRLKREDFLNRMISEIYPEFKDSNVRLEGDQSYYKKGKIFVREQPDVLSQLSDLIHEGAHRYDDEVLNYKGKELSNSALRKSIDPTQTYEILSEGHHAKIPDLREGSIGYGGLKSMLKNGTFKGIAPILAKGATTIGGGMLSLASEAADSEDMGDVTEQSALLREIDEKKRRNNAMKISTPEQQKALGEMYKNIDNGMTSEQRKKALDMLLKQQGNIPSDKEYDDYLNYKSNLEKRNVKLDEGEFDLRNYFNNAKMTPEEGNHLSDEYKKSNHPTFSTDSKSSVPIVNQGGEWRDDNGWKFKPSSMNIQNAGGVSNLQRYFNEVETPEGLDIPNNQKLSKMRK